MRLALATVFLWGYGLMFLGVGLGGVLWAPWEMRRVFELDPAILSDPATMVAQYRFLRACEAAFGLFCLLKRRDILGGGPDCIIFLAGSGLGVLARTIAWIIDGRPDGVFLLFLLLEAMTFLLVWLAARRERG